jgi:hypothetical protein
MTVRTRVFLVSLAVLGLANHLGAEESKAGAQSPEISGIVAPGQPSEPFALAHHSVTSPSASQLSSPATPSTSATLSSETTKKSYNGGR